MSVFTFPNINIQRRSNFSYSLQSRFGELRFQLEYLKSNDLLRVTIVDAWDLPPMNENELADPYVEVSLRTKSSTVEQDKFTTSIKPNCLNPIFNETSELPLLVDDVETGELVIKVMDSDCECQDEMIGTVRLPLSYLSLSSDSKEHTCLILHDKEGQEGLVEDKENPHSHQLSSSAAASLQLKISDQASKIYDIQLLLKSASDELEQVNVSKFLVPIKNYHCSFLRRLRNIPDSSFRSKWTWNLKITILLPIFRTSKLTLAEGNRCIHSTR